MTSLSYRWFSATNRHSTDFQTCIERHFTPGRSRGIGNMAGLEIWAAETKTVVHRKTGISYTSKSRETQA